MAVVTGQNLTLSESEGRATINVRYTTTFNEFERQMAGLGMRWHAHITAHGVDNGVLGPSIEAVTDAFGTPNITPSTGTGDEVESHVHEVEVDRDELQEDANGADEIKCKVVIHTNNFPPEFSEEAITDQESLG